jgi:hypothetical protein
MTEPEKLSKNQEPTLELTDADVWAAMPEIPGYLDNTPQDFKAIYLLAYRHAKTRLAREKTAGEIMTREVAAVPEETPLTEAAALLGQHCLHSIAQGIADGRPQEHALEALPGEVRTARLRHGGKNGTFTEIYGAIGQELLQKPAVSWYGPLRQLDPLSGRPAPGHPPANSRPVGDGGPGDRRPRGGSGEGPLAIGRG